MPSHLKAVVAPNVGRTLGVFVAAREPCIGMAEEPPMEGRTVRPVQPSGLHALVPPASIALAVVLCPGDTTADVSAWASHHSVADDRVHFFWTPGVLLGPAFASWSAGGRTVRYGAEVADWKSLNRRFGAFWNAWIHDDHCTVPGCRMR